MNKSELIQAVSEKADLSKADAGRAIDAVFDAIDRKSTRLNSSHIQKSRMPSSA